MRRERSAAETNEPAGRPAFGHESVHAQGRLTAWLILAGLMVVAAFALPALIDTTEFPADSFYRFETAIGGVLVFAFLLGLVLLVTPAPRRDALAARAPRTWRWPLAVGAAIVGGSLAFDFLYDFAFGPFEIDQGVPDFWDGTRVPAFLANLALIAVVGPIVEEVMYRGVGFTLLQRYGTWTAIVVTAVLFGLAHGYLSILPGLIVSGLALGWLRARTGSIYPGILVHGVFNAIAVILTVALE